MMNWSYIEKVLKEVNIPQNLRSIIMSIISNVSMKVIWNGQKGEYLKLKKGLRHVDLLSQYLFVLCIDRLSRMIMVVMEKKD